jgi:hypothetical protein
MSRQGNTCVCYWKMKWPAKIVRSFLALSTHECQILDFIFPCGRKAHANCCMCFRPLSFAVPSVVFYRLYLAERCLVKVCSNKSAPRTRWSLVSMFSAVLLETTLADCHVLTRNNASCIFTCKFCSVATMFLAVFLPLELATARIVVWCPNEDLTTAPALGLVTSHAGSAIKDAECLVQLSGYWLLKKDSVPWR